jgi:hypothetical protein
MSSESGQKPTFNDIFPKWDEAGNALMRGDKTSSAKVLSSIPDYLLRHTIGLTASSISILERGGAKGTEEEITQKLIARFRIMERLMDIKAKRPVSQNEDFSIWEADEEELKKYWENFKTLRQLFKNDGNEFQNNLDHMSSRDVSAYFKLASIHVIISDVKRHGENPQAADLDLDFYSSLSSRLIRKALEIKGKLG